MGLRRIRRRLHLPTGDAAIIQADESMTPTLEVGDVVTVTSHGLPWNGAIVCVAIEGRPMLRRWYRAGGGVTLTCDNPAYPPLYREAEIGIRVIGLACGVIRTLNSRGKIAHE